MITRSDDAPEFGPDDPLATLLRPPAEYLAPPAGRYGEIRRRATGRKLRRAAAGLGASCAVVALAVLPLRLASSHEGPPEPAVPLAPPPASAPHTAPDTAPSAPPPSRVPDQTPSAPRPLSPSPSASRPSDRAALPGRTDTPSRAGAPSRAPSRATVSPGRSAPTPRKSGMP